MSSWWDTANLTNFASQAIKTATKKIDKVLDIKEEDEGDSMASALQASNENFFTNWLNDGSAGSQSSALSSSDTLNPASDVSSEELLSPINTPLPGKSKSSRDSSFAIDLVGGSESLSNITAEVSSFFSSWTGKDVDTSKTGDAGNTEKDRSISNASNETPIESAVNKQSKSRNSLKQATSVKNEKPADVKKNSQIDNMNAEVDKNQSNVTSDLLDSAYQSKSEQPVNISADKYKTEDSEMYRKVNKEKHLGDSSVVYDEVDFSSKEMSEGNGWDESDVTFSMLIDSTKEKTVGLGESLALDASFSLDNANIVTNTSHDTAMQQMDASLDIEQPQNVSPELSHDNTELIPVDSFSDLGFSEAGLTAEQLLRPGVEQQKISAITRIMSEGSCMSSDGTPMESSIETSGDDLSESNRTVCADDSDETTPRNSAPEEDMDTSEKKHSEFNTALLSESLIVFDSEPKSSHITDLFDNNDIVSSYPREDHLAQLEQSKEGRVEQSRKQREEATSRNWIEELNAGSHDTERSEYVKSYVESSALHLEMSECLPDEEAGGANQSPQSHDDSSEERVVKLTDGVREQDGVSVAERSSDSPRSIDSSGSYVKNLLEDAMAESTNIEERRYGFIDAGGRGMKELRVSSAHSSGHTSGDEIDTTTSSDIEIISHVSSTPNGGGSTASSRMFMAYNEAAAAKYRQQTFSGRQDERMVRRIDQATSPQEWTSRKSAGGHRRTDSGSSAQSLQSRTSEEWAEARQRSFTERKHSGSKRDRAHGGEAAGGEERQSSPYDVDKLLKKLAEMAEILDARERRQLELSEENVGLHESNAILKNQLVQMEKASEAEMEDVKAVTEEFTRRIGEMDKRLKEVSRERDTLKRLVQEAEAESGKRGDAILTEKLLKEKEQVIAELLEEGEKLSKQQLNSNNIIKKLRAKEKENDSAIKTFRQRCDEQKIEIEKLEAILENKVAVEKKNVESFTQLNTLLKQQEEEVSRLKNELEDSTEKSRCMKVALDNSYKEISELHKERVSHVSEVQTSALNAEVQAREQLKQLLDETMLQAKRDHEALNNQIEDLQLSLSRMEKEHGRREDLLRQEISDLQLRLQEAEERNQDLTQNMSAATRPLLRQIENIQSTYAVQLSTYERVEKNLTDRLGEAQAQLIEAQEKERTASERLLDVSTKVTGLESIVSSLREERSRLLAGLEVERSKLDMLDEARRSDSAQKEAVKHKYEHEITELKKEKLLLENHLEMEKMKCETEARKLQAAQDQLREKEMLLSMRMSPSFSREDSTVSESSTVTASSLTHEEKQSMTTSAHGMTRVSVYDSMRQSSASLMLDSLQSQLKQREGEILQLQNEIRELERTREAMARELVNQSEKNDKQEELIQELSAFKQRHTEVDGRYNALLQMYGEKVEEADELRLDLQDIKEMYKAQIDELLNKSGQSRGGL